MNGRDLPLTRARRRREILERERIRDAERSRARLSLLVAAVAWLLACMAIGASGVAVV